MLISRSVNNRNLAVAKSSKKAQPTTAIRLDKWLWAARFYKTRSLAREMVQGGKVFYDGQRSKPSKAVELGVIIKLRQGNEEKSIEVLQLSDQRRGAPEAQLLYQETTASLELREKNAELRRLHALDSPRPDRRPDKKQRRKIIQFKTQDIGTN
ncbi:MAG: ribosome-associated heat shock protein Hsp15 [Gammaproteobacteria bacterium]|nr:ribosome-associated heat shock protein Hsp15 [Gammaproteobacteria bacterium]